MLIIKAILNIIMTIGVAKEKKMSLMLIMLREVLKELLNTF